MKREFYLFLSCVFFIGLKMPFAFASDEVLSNEWRKSTSLVDESGSCPSANAPLFRGVNGEFFTYLHAVKAMLGEQVPQLSARRLYSVLEERNELSAPVQNWSALKDISDELNVNAGLKTFSSKRESKKWQEAGIPNSRCQVAYFSQTQTLIGVLGGTEETRRQSLSIPFTKNYSIAAAYAGASSNIRQVVIEIKETVARAGLAKNDEWYVPVLIPQDEIISATTLQMQFRKSKSGQDSIIEIYKIRPFNHYYPLEEIQNSSNLLGVIRECKPNESCHSEVGPIPPEEVWEFNDLSQFLAQSTIQGKHFKIAKP